ncbi:WGR domain-containing protein [Roseibium salinum]|uniref:WGR domain-containing protein n=1 Tax=Roseibium salinum TaxID=1604349 RepID=UPI003609EE4F
MEVFTRHANSTTSDADRRRDTSPVYAEPIIVLNRGTVFDSNPSLDHRRAHRHNVGMETHGHLTLLTRIEPRRNMARFYSLSIEPTFFGGFVVHRSWGRLGTWGSRVWIIVWISARPRHAKSS